MPITIPAAENYQSPLVAVPSRVLMPPREGNKSIPCEVDWSIMGGANQSIYINLQNNATLEFSQVVALKVDNSECGASVRFIFTDTNETVTIPAYTPDAIVEVFTNQTQFYLVAEGAIATDVTRFQLLNFLPPPVVVPISTEQQTAVVGSISSGAAASAVIIPPTVNGTLENLLVQFGCASPAADSNAVATFSDGNGKVIARCPVFVKTGVPANVVSLNLSDAAVRFEGGIECTISGLLIASGEYSVNVYYRLP